ncbi:MAG: HepT-like ribonuclease domain-containing protein, partial [bacterium]
MAHDIPTTLVQMAESLDAIAEYTSGVVELAFVGDRILRDAVARRLEIVGEAVARLPEGYLMSHPEVPWRRVKNLRNHLSHKYDDVD